MLKQRDNYPKDIKNAQGTLSKTQHVAMLKAAIAANLDAREKHAAMLARRPASPAEDIKDIKVINCADLLGADDNWLELDEIIADPIRRALKAQMKHLGKRLYAVVGSTDAMREVCEEVANYNPKRWGTRTDIMDKNWNGVGDGNDRWWS